MKKQASFVSVIVPFLDSYDSLTKCLFCLENQTYDSKHYEVLAIDNGPNVKSYPSLATFSHTKLLYEPRRGSYSARNHGIIKAKGDILAFTDADCLPASTWLEKGVRTLKARQNCGLVGGSVMIFYKDSNFPTLAEKFDKLTGFKQKDYIRSSHFSVTANLFTTKKVMEQVGMFDSQLHSGGDVQWGNRVHKMGFSLQYAPEVIVYHLARKTFGQILNKHKRVCQGFDPLRASRDNLPMGRIGEWLRRMSPPVSSALSILKAHDAGTIVERYAMVILLFYIKYFRLLVRAKRCFLDKF